jgi:RNA polymerase sigma-70 factor (ECF subfamily)
MTAPVPHQESVGRMTRPTAAEGEARAAFARLLGELRPRLHRYCARMTGSVIDGEDAVQDAIVKAIEAYDAAAVDSPESWLFRIAHNAAIDLLRRRGRRQAVAADEDLEMIVDPANVADERQIVGAGLRTFMRLPVAQRSSIILMDVLGYSLKEIAAILDASIPAVKAALHRGRERLRELAGEPDERRPPVLTGPQRALFAAYVDRFNARDFDAIRDMLADEVRLELVARTRMSGRKEVGTYLHNYAGTQDWRLVMCLVEGRPAVLVRDPEGLSQRLLYFVLLEWRGDRLVGIRDFRYARYAVDDAEWSILAG